MASVQLNFALRTTSNARTVHLLGSWDGYRSQLPLAKDSSKSGGWKGAFRFQSNVLKQGQRYWYYYIVDGLHALHDPGREYVIEPTTKRPLNVLDIPVNKSQATAPPPAKSSRDSSQRHSRKTSTNCAKGRPLSVSDIQSPRPRKPTETRAIRHEQFSRPTLEQLSAKFASYQIEEDDESDNDSEIDAASDSGSDLSVPSLTSHSSRSSNGSGASSPSSVSSVSSCCTCERYGITRSGSRVKLDCKGTKCGYSDGSECSSDSDGDYRRGQTRRNGVVIRH